MYSDDESTTSTTSNNNNDDDNISVSSISSNKSSSSVLTMSTSSSSIISDSSIKSSSTPHIPLYELFKFRQPYKYEKFSKSIKYNLASTTIFVLLVPNTPLWGNLCSTKYIKASIQHGIAQISNPAPTLEQYYQQFKVYHKDLNTKKRKNLIQLDPPQTFYASINTNFRFANNARYHKQLTTNIYNNKSLAYWLYYDPITKQQLKLDILHAKIIYCQKYTNQILNYKPARIAFYTLLDEFKATKTSIEIVSYGVKTTYQSFSSANDVEQFFMNDLFDFPDCYVLMELLLYYPKMELCIWNRVNEIL